MPSVARHTYNPRLCRTKNSQKRWMYSSCNVTSTTNIQVRAMTVRGLRLATHKSHSRLEETEHDKPRGSCHVMLKRKLSRAKQQVSRLNVLKIFLARLKKATPVLTSPMNSKLRVQKLSAPQPAETATKKYSRPIQNLPLPKTPDCHPWFYIQTESAKKKQKQKC